MSAREPKNIISTTSSHSPLRILIDQIRSPLIYILIFAGLVTFAIQDYIDTIVISLTIVINSSLGFFQEYKAQNALEKLKSMIKHVSLVEINGDVKEIDSALVDMNDVVILTSDYNVPADGILIEGDLTVNEHLLTGESVPVSKGPGDKVYTGTTIVGGYAKMRVETIGDDTKFGEISKSVAETVQEQTPLQKQLSSLAKVLSIVVLCTTSALFVVGILSGYPVFDMFVTSVAVAVASVPEGLIIALTVILAVGIQKILKHKAVVRKLMAAETLGSVTTICVDKTGTITEGKLKVGHSEITDEHFFKVVMNLANNKLDVLEKATKQWSARNIRDFSDESIKEFKRLDFLPFNSRDKFTSTLVERSDGAKFLLTYGAAEMIVDNSTLSEAQKKQWHEKISGLADQGYKMIGYGYKQVEGRDNQIKLNDISGLTWCGTLGLADTLRKGIKETFDKCREAGIKIKVITGDHMNTAIEIARQAGVIDESHTVSEVCVLGSDLEGLSKNELRKVVSGAVVFARTTPVQKLRIIECLSDMGEVVAMTGDGVNDAPALKKAAVSLVVNEASDVSKDIADIVLLDSNLGTIVKAIEEGRRIFHNIKKVVLYLLSDSLSELILVTVSVLMKLPLPILAAQIIWINLIENSAPALSLALEPKEADIMKNPPRKKDEFIIDKKMLRVMIFFVLITDLTLVGLFNYLYRGGMDLALVRTIIFATLGVDSLVYIFSCKSIHKPIIKYYPFSNKYMNLAVFLGMSLLVLAVHLPVLNTLLRTVPITLGHWGIVMGFGAFNLVVIETLKALTYGVGNLRVKAVA